MSKRAALAVVVGLGWGGEAEAAPDGGVAETRAPAPSIAQGPEALGEITPAYPGEALEAEVEGDVWLVLTLDETGAVTKVEVERGLPYGLSDAAIAAAKAARFRPAVGADGKPTAVRLRWIVRFLLPARRTDGIGGPADGGAGPDGGPDRAAAEAPAPTGATASTRPAGTAPLGSRGAGMLKITVREKGTGKYLPDATVFIEDTSEELDLDGRAHAEKALDAGAYVIVVRAAGHAQEERIERIRAGETLSLNLFVHKERRSLYETILRAKPDRAQTGIVSLEAEEIHNVPGTFGDPFRAVMLLPGVASPFSGLGYPVVRGEAPGSTGTFIDDIRVPLLYHLGFGPAVVHPMYIAALDFHAGGFPAQFGRFTAGLIRARTPDPPEERQSMAEVDLFKFSGFHTQPITLGGRKASFSAAARYGTFTFLARAIDPHAVLEYWDYQTRADVPLGPGAFRLLLFGSKDTIGTQKVTDMNGMVTGEDNLTRIGFHRADLRYRADSKRIAAEAGIEVGNDFTRADRADGNGAGGGGADQGPLVIDEYLVRPRLTVDVRARPGTLVRWGGDVLFQNWANPLIGDFNLFGFPSRAATLGAFAQADWQPAPRLLVAPGVRVDHYRFHTETADPRATGVDPRVAGRFRVRPDLFVKASAGLYHAPPRFIVPWPGIGAYGLKQHGLNSSWQFSLGAEWSLPWDATLDAQTYLHLLPSVAEATLTDAGLNTSRPGRAYGVELIARRRLGNRLFGWLTYSLARSERDFDGIGWRVSDFDQTHIVNTVASYALGRAWTISGTFHLNSGRPTGPDVDGQPDNASCGRFHNVDRLPSFWRVDARIEKREAFDTWFLDFYVDWLNISLKREVAQFEYQDVDCTKDPPYSRRLIGEAPLLTIPTIGLRGVF